MNVKELNEKYQRIQNWQDEYRKELISYINEAFAMHGNEFVLKPEGYNSWEEAVKSDDFCACEDLPTWLMIWDRHEFSHEIYPTRIYRVSDSGMTYIDGYDNTEGEFVEEWYANDDNDDLSSIASFINAVLEQESRKFRTFKQGERVAVCTNRGNYQAVVVHDTNVEYEDDLVEVHVFRNEEDDDSSGISTGSIEASDVYQYANEKVCPRCGNPLFIEHHEEIDYPYFCPWCDENFYNIEVQ